MTPQLALHIRSAMLCLLAPIVTGACAPVFSDARLVGKGQFEITPNLSAAGFSAEGESEHVVNNFGVHGLVGLHERADVDVGYMRAQIANEDSGVNILEFGPKFSLVRDRAAFALPMGFVFGENTDVGE
ncbi:MAG TPA: hypothetical protein VES67_26290 [Vicinamibacterales bacterium]|nr:hypothetical protein [Vicinamibacterales bacterium]